MKYGYLWFAGLVCLLVEGTCNKPDHAHVDKNIVRCAYTQEDIYRGYSKKIRCYTCERHKECFYCGCAIAEHTKNEVVKKKKK